jgi:hypothetical protein
MSLELDIDVLNAKSLIFASSVCGHVTKYILLGIDSRHLREVNLYIMILSEWQQIEYGYKRIFIKYILFIKS